jgi:hypothetical protein
LSNMHVQGCVYRFLYVRERVVLVLVERMWIALELLMGSSPRLGDSTHSLLCPSLDTTIRLAESE